MASRSVSSSDHRPQCPNVGSPGFSDGKESPTFVVGHSPGLGLVVVRVSWTGVRTAPTLAEISSSLKFHHLYNDTCSQLTRHIFLTFALCLDQLHLLLLPVALSGSSLGSDSALESSVHGMLSTLTTSNSTCSSSSSRLALGLDVRWLLVSFPSNMKLVGHGFLSHATGFSLGHCSFAYIIIITDHYRTHQFLVSARARSLSDLYVH